MRILALVGADGMGKTTQAQLLAERLTAAGHRVARVQPLLALFNPWGNRPDASMGRALSPRLRRAAADQAGGRRGALRRMLRGLTGLLYAAASYAFLRARFRQQEILVCDRYFYQYFYDLFGMPATGIALMFPRPTVAFWLDGSPELVRVRTADENVQGDWRPYYESLMHYYRAIAGPLGFVRIDAEAPAREVTETIWRQLALLAREPAS